MSSDVETNIYRIGMIEKLRAEIMRLKETEEEWRKQTAVAIQQCSDAFKERDACIKAHDENVALMKEFQKLMKEAGDKISILEIEFEKACGLLGMTVENFRIKILKKENK